jgi:hypothetical protein
MEGLNRGWGLHLEGVGLLTCTPRLFAQCRGNGRSGNGLAGSEEMIHRKRNVLFQMPNDSPIFYVWGIPFSFRHYKPLQLPFSAETPHTQPRMLSEDLVKGPRVLKTAVPHLVDRLDRIEIALALRPAPHRLHRSPPHTILMVVGEFKDLVSEELVGPSALSAQRTRPYL